MSDVKYIRAKAIGCDEEWIPVVGLGGNIPSGGTAVPITIAVKTIVVFTSTKTPGLTNYQAQYAPLYGEYPFLTLRTIDSEGVVRERIEKPGFVMAGDLISSIAWDFPDEESGYIIIS